MNINRAYNLQVEIMGQYKSLASRAVHFGLPHDDILTALAAIRLKLDSLKAPRRIGDYLKGYHAATTERWYLDDLAWCHVEPTTGTLYVAHRRDLAAPFDRSVDELYQAKRGAEVAAWKHGHYWIKASIREHGYERPAKLYFGG